MAARALVQTKPRNPAPALSFQGHSRSQGRVFFFFFLIPKTICLGLQLINNVVIVPVNSEEAQSYIYMYPFSPKPQGRVFLNGGELGALRMVWIWADFDRLFPWE